MDWSRREVHVASHVVLPEGPLEFLACFAGKEHESILRFDARAAHIYAALGLLGFEPGRPPTWDPDAERYLPAAGDLLSVRMAWEADGRMRVADWNEWILEIEYARPPIGRPWLFAGSRVSADGSLAADESGEGIALVDMPACLLALSRSHVSRDADLWATVNTSSVPPLDTPVTVIIGPPQPLQFEATVDARGAPRIDGRLVEVADLIDLLELQRRQAPASRPVLRVAPGALESDVDRLRRLLGGSEAGEARVRFERGAP